MANNIGHQPGRTNFGRPKTMPRTGILACAENSKRGELGEVIKIDDEIRFKKVAEEFIREFPIMTEGHRNKQYVDGHTRVCGSISRKSAR
jgi:hypothetical protein